MGRLCSASGPSVELRYRPVEAVVLRFCSTGWVAASALSANTGVWCWRWMCSLPAFCSFGVFLSSDVWHVLNPSSLSLGFLWLLSDRRLALWFVPLMRELLNFHTQTEAERRQEAPTLSHGVTELSSLHELAAEAWTKWSDAIYRLQHPLLFCLLWLYMVF